MAKANCESNCTFSLITEPAENWRAQCNRPLSGGALRVPTELRQQDGRQKPSMSRQEKAGRQAGPGLPPWGLTVSQHGV